MSDSSPLEIHHDVAQQRFVATVDRQLCVLDYQLAGEVMAITHTGVPEALAGRGIAGALTRRALDTARQRGWKVRPLCSYAAVWLRRHTDYQDLLA